MGSFIDIAPDLHTVIYEDDKMRVLKVAVPEGTTAQTVQVELEY